ncbi:methyl-accepting chemotaxis protein [Glaciecola sp. KUL10]|uniref:methyl-accepting chemotaxis protein n=1 Tax=Glaciecola sp. (strain KUL10) TaxID=2161813 RepID=UPI000D78A4DC|nr:methyl-accepting chemotaxis protein [Glaciecola sp. KUL10]GBL05922.1 chemotaxis sensory transducer [Glaciecola sp. KUL10]
MQSLLTDNKVKVDEMITAINQTLETGKQNLEAIDTVEQLSREIDKVSEASGVVAIKTAMLAVNGAVEAARAGEFGKGFAVVSDDIQNLADDAAENVEQIKDLVKDIQNQAVRVRMDLADVADASAQEAQRAQKTTTDLEQVDAEMKSLIDDSNEILDGVNEVVTAVDQAKKGMEQIAAANEQAIHSATEASTASSQQAQGAEELAAAIEEIASIADELQSA